MGGLVATRSIGQFSTYGGIEDLVCGLEAVLPDGEIIRIRNVPRRSTGPDLRHLIVGSEGGIAFITEVTVKIFRFYPESFWRGGYIVPSMEEGFETIRKIITAGYRPSVVRLYDKSDYDYNYGNVELNDSKHLCSLLQKDLPLSLKLQVKLLSSLLERQIVGILALNL